MNQPVPVKTKKFFRHYPESHPLRHSIFSWPLWYIISSSHKKTSIAVPSKPVKMTLPGADQPILHSTSDVQSVHRCQVSPRHPELFVCKWSPDQHCSLEIMEPKQSLGICTSGVREEFIQAMEHEKLCGHDHFKNGVYLSHCYGIKTQTWSPWRGKEVLKYKNGGCTKA